MNITAEMNAIEKIAALKQEQATATDFEQKMSNFECFGCGS